MNKDNQKPEGSNGVCIKNRHWRSKCFQILPKLLALTGYPQAIAGLEVEKHLPDIVTFTQTNWLRKAKERWESSFGHLESLPINQLSSLLQRPCLDRQNPKKVQHDYWVIMGGRVERMIDRMKFASLLFYDGYITPEILFLSGDRHLLPDEIEVLATFGKLERIEFDYNIKNENQVPIVLRKWLKEKMPHVQIGHVTASKPEGAERSNTFDTLKELMAHLKLKHISYAPCLLLITNNVYVLYQAVVAEAVYSQDAVARYWHLEGAGDGITANSEVTIESIGYALDSIARAIYFLSKTEQTQV